MANTHLPELLAGPRRARASDLQGQLLPDGAVSAGSAQASRTGEEARRLAGPAGSFPLQQLLLPLPRHPRPQPQTGSPPDTWTHERARSPQNHPAWCGRPRCGACVPHQTPPSVPLQHGGPGPALLVPPQASLPSSLREEVGGGVSPSAAEPVLSRRRTKAAEHRHPCSLALFAGNTV